jgi:S1-C subfamily serine protease
MSVNCGGASTQIKSEDSFEEYSFGVVALVQPALSADGVSESDPSDLDNYSRNSTGEEHEVYCSGFFVSDREILTAAHCVQRLQFIESIFGSGFEATDESPVGDIRKISTYSQYRLDGGNFLSYKLVKVSKYNREQDVALLELLPNQSPGFHKVFKIGKSPHLGDKVSAIGHPSGLAWTLTQGIISSEKRFIDKQAIVQTSAMTFFGNSGCPLIDANGNAIGVASMIARTPHLAFYTHVDVIREFIN